MTRLFPTASGLLLVLLLLLGPVRALLAQDALIDAFPIEHNDLTLTRLAQPGVYFDKAGRKFAVLGDESGAFEAWAYPLKLFRDFRFSFFIGSSTEPIHGRDIVHRIATSPEATTITYTFQSFTVRAHYVTAVDAPGAVILLEVDTTEPLRIVCSFVPVMQPMWPAGLGGQFARWDESLKAYLISESSRKNHGFLGSPAAAGLSYTPAHMLSDQPNQFSIPIDDGAAVRHKYIPIAMAGGPGERDDVRAQYLALLQDPEGLYREARAHFEALRRNTLRVTTPDERLNRAYEWAKVSYDNLLVDNPHLPGVGLVAGLGRSGSGGRPGFGWFFGADAYLNTFSLNAMGYHDASRQALAFTRLYQRDDGKMAHELTQSAAYVDWFGDFPYAYIHADTSPYYIVAVYDYYRATGDLEFVQQSWESVLRAYAWCLTTDADGDGLMDNRLAGLGALEFGALTGIQTDIYLAAVWIRATEAMQYLATAMGNDGGAEQAAAHFTRAREAFEQFWDDQAGQYVYAFAEDRSRVREVTPWSAVGLMWGYGRPDRATRTLETLSSAALTTDWGVRMLSDASRYFEPLNYNYGAVWPFLTSWVNTAQYKRGFALQGYSALMSTVQHVEHRALGHVTEVFSGAQHTWPQESVPHQGFCTAGTVLPFIRGLLGLEGSAPDRTLVFEPSLPVHWDHVSVENYRLGEAVFGIEYHRYDDAIAVEIRQQGGLPYRIRFSPALSPGTRVVSATVNGAPLESALRPVGQVVRPTYEFDLGATVLVEIRLQPGLAVVPPVWESEVGDRSRGLKILSFDVDDDTAQLTLEGLAGQAYTLPLRHTGRIDQVIGGALDGDALHVTFPEGPTGTFVRHDVVMRLRGDP